MLTEPTITERPEQPYASMTERVTMSDIGLVLPPLHAQVAAWLQARGSAPVGAPFWKYDVIDMSALMEVEVGWPIFDALEGDESVRIGVIPAGRYVTATFTGHPMGLEGATATVLDWARRHDLSWDVAVTDAGEVWGARLEIYETDPADEPDMSQWVTTLAFRLAD
jgi:effector-binding domain-containing protein